jgi:hypothetical protein
VWPFLVLLSIERFGSHLVRTRLTNRVRSGLAADVADLLCVFGPVKGLLDVCHWIVLSRRPAASPAPTVKTRQDACATTSWAMARQPACSYSLSEFGMLLQKIIWHLGALLPLLSRQPELLAGNFSSVVRRGSSSHCGRLSFHSPALNQ